MPDWFYVRDGQQAGPVDADRLTQLLATGVVKPGDLVWRDGLPNWIEAASVQELRPVAPTPVTPPAPTFNASPAQPIATQPPVAQYHSPQAPGQSMAMPPHSRLGVAAFLIALFAIVIEIASIAGAVAVGTRRAPAPTPVPTTNSTVQVSSTASKGSTSSGLVAAGFGMFGGVFLCLVGVTLGIVSLYRQGRKVFGILGVVINGGVLLLFIALMLIGLLAR